MTGCDCNGMSFTGCTHSKPTGARVVDLTPDNVAAIRQTMPWVVTTATTATFPGRTARRAQEDVQATIAALSGRGHPKASLHAVVRKLGRAAGEAITS